MAHTKERRNSPRKKSLTARKARTSVSMAAMNITAVHTIHRSPPTGKAVLGVVMRDSFPRAAALAASWLALHQKRARPGRPAMRHRHDVTRALAGEFVEILNQAQSNIRRACASRRINLPERRSARIQHAAPHLPDQVQRLGSMPGHLHRLQDEIVKVRRYVLRGGLAQDPRKDGVVLRRIGETGKDRHGI